MDGLGNPDEVISSEDPTAGSDVYLTIDPDLQRETYNIIEKNLSEILLSKINNSKSAGTKGVSDKDIRIPIYDVYFAFINNEIINTNHFQLNDSYKIVSIELPYILHNAPLTHELSYEQRILHLRLYLRQS